ncbi:hypothetical protein Huta_0070 [Halorhabdus utahensis DSM 12940]|uniref:Uncharacterized protein n=1 Tax=Halorhabdus utahensis (strain DSM 12940 / JCM 11049 / AX-2) TaxID=519442 RepID=C7NNN1_HALUD|nr:hypothetical protein [Halorhabdus utahensis]ACV10259.1 hypothetical protein Huta_0070 [Halorhabdus utahensis DSM 12940]
MDPSEKALESLLADDESLVESWTVDTVTRGFEFSPPGLGGTETVGLTDRRIVWLDDELETVDLEDIRSVGVDSVGQSLASMLLITGPIATVLGAIVTIVLRLFTSLPAPLTLAPLGIGLCILVAALVGSRLQDPEDVDRQYYLDMKTLETTVQIYATESTVVEMTERVNTALQ